jgi:hypothetical protein
VVTQFGSDHQFGFGKIGKISKDGSFVEAQWN